MSAVPNTAPVLDAEVITVLQAKPGLSMTKTFTPSGVKSYDQAKFFTPHTRHITGIRDLSALLADLAGKPRCCIIRGVFRGVEHAQAIEGAVDGPNMFARRKVLFDDPPRRLCLIDVDGFEPLHVDPTAEPVKAIEQYIEKHLPACFQGKSYHWQMSASAGTPGKRHLLKAHLWFWLKTPYTSAQMNAWAKSIGPAVDSAVFRTVQVHYTANPVFKDGATDPVPVRFGLEEGWDGDEVDLVINEALLLRATQEEDEDESDLVDPRQKKGVIGAFHRAFTVEEVLERWLADEFHFAEGSDKRITWVNGGGTPEGAFVTDDRMHICSVHNTDPLDNKATNLFDMVRHFKYGHLDEGMDDFEALDLTTWPSYQAMLDELMQLPEIQAELAQADAAGQAEKVNVRDTLLGQITAATSEIALREEACLAIRLAYNELQGADIDVLLAALQQRFQALTGARLSKDSARELIAPPRREMQRREGMPRWAHGYVFVTSQNKIYRYDSDEWLGREAFEFKHNRDAGFDDNGMQISAFALARDFLNMPFVERAVYMPQLPATFELDGAQCVNTYRPSSVPAAKARALWTEGDVKAINLIERHLDILCGHRPAVAGALKDWLAFNAQHPGEKINWTWLIVGGEGAGKTWIAELMATVMGGPNIRIVSAKEVLSDFNAYAEGHAFAVVEEIRIPGHKTDAWENLKAPLTNSTIAIIKKGQDGANVPNVTNYLLFSNHFDAVPVSLGGRRVGVIATPFFGDETKEQLNKMATGEGFASGEDYFDALFKALAHHGAAIREWLTSWSISPDFRPKGRAPETDERTAMAREGVAHEEEIVRLVVEHGAAWVTSKVVNPSRLQVAVEMWEDGGLHISEERLAFILRKMGYRRYGVLKYTGKAIRVWTKGVDLKGDATVDNTTLRNLLAESENLQPTPSADEDFLK